MIDREEIRGEQPAKPQAPDADEDEKLPYRIELWNADGTQVERTIARALNNSLARAIFKAALSELPGRRITLNKADRLILDSSNQE